MNKLRKIIRFFIAFCFIPVAISWLFLDWLYESEGLWREKWLKHLLFRDY